MRTITDQEWHELRTRSIGASDPIMHWGHSPYESRYAAWYRWRAQLKSGEVEPVERDADQLSAMRDGAAIGPALVQIAADRHDLLLWDPNLRYSAMEGGMVDVATTAAIIDDRSSRLLWHERGEIVVLGDGHHATLDGVGVAKDGSISVIEAKVVGRHAAAAWADGPPPHVWAQVELGASMLALHVTNSYGVTAIVVALIDGRVHTWSRRVENARQDVVLRAAAGIVRSLEAVAPPTDWQPDEHDAAKAAMRAAARMDAYVAHATDDQAAMIAALDALAEQARPLAAQQREIEKKQKELRARLCDSMTGPIRCGGRVWRVEHHDEATIVRRAYAQLVARKDGSR